MNQAYRQMWKYIRRAPFQALAAISVLTITFFLVTVFLLVTLGSEVTIRHFESRPQVTAFFKDSATETDISQIQSSINKIDGVTSTNFISKNHALEIYREQNKADPLLLEMVTADILPASLEVRAANPQVLLQIAEIMTQQRIVEEVVYQKDIVNNLLQWTQAIRIGGFALVLFLLCSSLFVIMIIISMKVSLHKEEIEIIRLLGGSKGHIAAPFLLEAILYGIVGSFIGWGFAYILLLYSTPFIVNFVGMIALLPVPLWIMFFLLGAEVLLGMFIGFLASIFATRRFLK